jgi:ribosomal protein L37E
MSNTTETVVWPAIGPSSGVTSTTSPHPDWTKVPFDVGCARCGHDLRGQAEPVCPACGLTFAWREAVPIEELVCATCGYHLYGLRENRCPECGGEFTWDDALERHYRKSIKLFEYQAGRRPIRSLVSTWFRTLRPNKFWNGVRLTDPPRVRRLVVTLVVSFALYLACAVLLGGFQSWFGEFMGYWAWYGTVDVWRWLEALPVSTLKLLSGGFLYAQSFVIVAWMVLTLLAMLVFQQSMRRCKVRNVQLVRVWVYACSPHVAFVTALGYVTGCLVIWFDNSAVWWWNPNPWIALFVVLFAGRSIQVAYRDYLRIPHSVGVAAANQSIAILAAGLIEMSVIPNIDDSVFFSWTVGTFEMITR